VLAERPFPRRLFVAWNLLGILDFIVAWAMLFIVSNTAVGVWGGSGPGVEAFFRFPESFIPMFGGRFVYGRWDALPQQHPADPYVCALPPQEWLRLGG
jgi:hypothetical protein